MATELLYSSTSLLPLLSSLALLAQRSLARIREDNLVFLATTFLFLAFLLLVFLVRPDHHILFQVLIILIAMNLPQNGIHNRFF